MKEIKCNKITFKNLENKTRKIQNLSNDIKIIPFYMGIPIIIDDSLPKNTVKFVKNNEIDDRLKIEYFNKLFNNK
jgi:hypothetical protein